MDIGAAIEAGLAARRTQAALVHDERSLDGDALLALSDSISAAWPPHAGARVALVARNRPGAVAALVAALRRRARLSMVHAAQSAQALAADVQRRTFDVVVADRDDWSEPLTQATRTSGALGIALVHGPATPEVECVTAHARSSMPVWTAGDDVALDLLSSGTTGLPKPTPVRWHTLEQAVLDARAVYAPAAGTNAAPRPAIVIQPLGNVAGVTFVVPALVYGQCIVLLERFDVRTWVDLVARHAPTRTSLPPTAIRMLLDAEVPPDRLRSLSVIGVGGAALDEATRARFEERYGIPLITAYGATEFGGVIANWTLDEYRRLGPAKRGSCGRPRPGIELRIVDPATGRAAGPGETGRLEARVPRVGPDWIATTDLAHLDSDGYLYLDGRSDDAINRGGFKIVPEQVAAALRAHPDVADAAVIGVPDPRLGAVPVAAVERKPGVSAIDLASLERACRERLLAYQVPVRFVVLDALPRTESMKVCLPALRSLLTASAQGGHDEAG